MSTTTPYCQTLLREYARTTDIWHRVCYPIEWSAQCAGDYNALERIRRDLNGFCEQRETPVRISKIKAWRGDLFVKPSK